MRKASLLLLAFLSSGMMVAAPWPTDPPKVPSPTFEKYTLSNGLEIILHEDHRLPLVALDLWYHVGPRNEVQGRSGFAHLFEHMMFEGSAHVGEKAHFRYLEGAGATDINGTTDFDRTNYFETLPSNQLELGLWLESDRMGFLLGKLDRTRLVNQRDVVRNERREDEGTPYMLAEEETCHLLFPKEHPYYAAVIGSHADMEAARLLDVRHFFQQFYTPNNATLAIAGAFDPATLKPLLQKYFGPIPQGPPVAQVKTVTPAITGERRATVTDTVQLPRVSVAWLTPPAFGKGDAESQLITGILGGGDSSRLYQKLVYEKQMAQSVHCETESLWLQSVARCHVTARPHIKPEALEAEMNREIDELRQQGSTQEELDRTRNIILTGKITALQRLGGFGGVADTLNLYNQYLGDPGYLSKDIARFTDATTASVKAMAEQGFAKSQRVTVYTVAGKKVLHDVPRSPASTDAGVKLVSRYPADFEAQQVWRKKAPRPGPTPKLQLPVPVVLMLANGLKVYLVEDHVLPVLKATVLDFAGADANPADQPGLAAYTARMLRQGTARRSATQIARDTDQMGAELLSGANEDYSSASIEGLSNNKEAALDLLSDITEHPCFQTDEVERVRGEMLTAIVEEADDPVSTVLRVGRKTVYGDGPYAYPSNGTTDSVKAISAKDLTDFWKAHFAPQNAALVLSGDVTEEQARELASRYFQSWSNAGANGIPPVPPAPSFPKQRIVIVDKPGAPQTVLTAFGVGLPRNTPDYVATDVMNNILGGLFSSRINMNLQERNGYTYDAFSFYHFHRGAGPFLAGALVRTDVTAPAAKELFKELQAIAVHPPNASEITLGKNFSLHSLPGQFETVGSTSSRIGDLFVYNLPIDYYRTLPSQYNSVSAAAITAAARKEVRPDQMIIVAVGDRHKIQPGLEKLGLGPIDLRDAAGNLLAAQ
jgi:zinc protease